jgi:hypothetical protein
VTRGLADTSLFVASETGRPVDESSLPDELAVSVVTIGELRAGVLAATDPDARARRLATLTRVLTIEPVPVDDDVADHWARLRVRLSDAGRRLGVNDSWIAATALALGVPIVTQDDDYDDVPGLEVVRV